MRREGIKEGKSLQSVSWPSSHSPGNVSSGILCSLSIRCYQRGKCHKPRAAFPECIREKILTISSSMRCLSVNLHVQLNVNCSLETFYFLRFNSFRLCSTQRMPASFCSGEGVTPGGQLTAMNSPPTGQMRLWVSQVQNEDLNSFAGEKCICDLRADLGVTLQSSSPTPRNTCRVVGSPLSWELSC